MPEGFISAADVPLQEFIGGAWFSLPLMTEDDLATLGRTLQRELATKAMRDLPATATAEREQVRQWYADNEPSIDDLTRYVYTIPGAKAVLRQSLAKSGASNADDVVNRLRHERGWQGVVVLAMEVSALWPAKERDAEGKRPEKNARGGATPAAAPPAEKSENPTDSAGSTSQRQPALTPAA